MISHHKADVRPNAHGYFCQINEDPVKQKQSPGRAPTKLDKSILFDPESRSMDYVSRKKGALFIGSRLRVLQASP